MFTLSKGDLQLCVSKEFAAIIRISDRAVLFKISNPTVIEETINTFMEPA